MPDKYQPLTPVPRQDGYWEQWPPEKPDEFLNTVPDRFQKDKPDCKKCPDCPGCPDQYEDYLS